MLFVMSEVIKMAIHYDKVDSQHCAACDEGYFPYSAYLKWLKVNPDEETWWKNYLRDCEIMEQELDEPLTHMPYFFWTEEDKLPEQQAEPEVFVEWDEDENNENGVK